MKAVYERLKFSENTVRPSNLPIEVRKLSFLMKVSSPICRKAEGRPQSNAMHWWMVWTDRMSNSKEVQNPALRPLISIYLLLIKGHLPICHPLTHWLAANVSLSFLALVSCKERKIKVEDQASWLHRSPIEGRFGDSRPSFGGNLWKPRLYCNFYFSPEVRR